MRDSKGRVIGTIGDMVLDTQRHSIRLIGLKPSDKGINSLVYPWSAYKLSPTTDYAGNPEITLEKNASPAELRLSDEAATRPYYLDVRRNLIGRTVLAADGGQVGGLKDLVLELQTGAVDYFLVTDRSVTTPKSMVALPWSAIADLVIEGDVVLTLDERQLQQDYHFISGQSTH